eukprot:gene24721-33195_t
MSEDEIALKQMYESLGVSYHPSLCCSSTSKSDKISSVKAIEENTEIFNAFKQSSLRQGVEEKEKYPRNYVPENTENFYDHFCVNNLELQSDLSVKLLRLLNGLNECPYIPCKSDNTLVCIDITQLRNVILSKFKLNIYEGQDFSISTLNNENLHYFGLLYLDRLTAFNVHLGPREKHFSESSDEVTVPDSALCEEFKCFICFEVMEEPTTLPCGHSACLHCLKKAFEASKKCSICNRKFNHAVVDALAVSIHLRSAISRIFPRLQCERDAKKVLLKQTLNDPAVDSRGKLKTLDELSAVSSSNLADGEGYSHENLIAAMPDDACKNLLRRAGCLGEISPEVYDHIRGITRAFLEDMIKDVIIIATNRGARTATVDTVIASKPLNYTVLGYGGDFGIRYVWSSMVVKVMAQVHATIHVDPQALSVFNDIGTFILMSVMERAIRLANESTVTATHFKVLSADGPSFPYELKFYGNVEDDDQLTGHLDTPVTDVRAADIQAAVRLLLSRELLKHAVSEGAKAVAKVSNADPTAHASMATKAGLQNDPRAVALVVSRAFKGYPISEAAAVYLAAVMEYLVAEVCELSGNAAMEKGCGAVSCRHVMLGIKNDAELNDLFKMCIIRDSGVIPHVQTLVLGSVEHIDSSVFENLLKAKSVGRNFIDPRTGRHSYFDGSSNTSTLRRIPMLDLMCKETTAERVALARQALSPDELAIMKSEGGFLISDRNEEDGSEEGNGWAEPSLAELHHRNLSDIRTMQESHHKVFNPYHFGRFVETIAIDFATNWRFTAEAMEFIHTVTEGYLVDFFQCSVLNAVHSGRILLEAKDLNLARRIRREAW